jgi:3'-5' exoribonuclease-like protein
MVNFHYDWEFKEDGVTIEPISLGMVDDNGRELYMIYGPAVTAFRQREYFNDRKDGLGLDQTDLWLRDNVFNHIPESDVDKYGYWDKRSMAECVYDFICDGLSYGQQAELWGYFAAYDHVCLSQLFGRMIDLPPPMPMFTNDLMTLGKLPNGRWMQKPSRPSDLPEHHSLMDAKYQKLVFEAWK